MSEPRTAGGAIQSTALHLVLILILGFFAYSNTFTSPFQFDDHPNITDNPLTKDISNIPSVLAGQKGPFASRSVMLATLALNYYFDGLNTRGYHAVNLALHLANGFLLYLLIAMTWRRLELDEEGARPAAAFSAILFVLHPMQTEAVTNIVNRSILLATTFALLGTVLFLKTITVGKRRGIYVAGLFLASLLGMGSRENFATFPIMLFLYDLFFISKFRLKEVMRHWPAYLPVVASLLYLAHLVLNNTYDKSVEYPGLGIPHAEYFVTQFKVHWTYLRLFVLPLNQTLDYGYPISKGLFEPPTLAAFAGYAGLWVGGFVLARKRPVIAYAAFCFLIVLLPISFGVTFLKLRIDDVIFEHRFYLPSVGLFVLAGVSAYLFYGRLRTPGTRRAAVALMLLLPLMLTLATHERNKAWQSELGLWEDVVRKAPGSERAHFNLGVAFDQMGRTDDAFGQYEESIALKSDSPKSHVGLGVIYARMGMLEEAIMHYKKAIDLWPEFPKAHYNLGNAHFKKGLIDEAIENYVVAVKQKPTYAEAHFNLGTAYFEKGLLDRAIEHYLIAIKLRPGYLKAHVNLSMAYEQYGLHNMAREHFRIAEDLKRKAESADK